MDIRALGYIGIDVADLEGWRRYADLLGTMVVADDGDGFAIKIDDRPWRIMVRQSESSEGLGFAGWEVADASALARAVDELVAAGLEPEEADAGQRGVRGLIRTRDPGGFTTEIFWGPVHDHRLFVSPQGVSGFVTGDLGLGHIVLGTTNYDAAVDFYTGLLGFRVSDYMGAGGSDVVFTHCNARHHSLALVPADESTLYHFMLEAETLDDVGFALERHHQTGTPISMGLGKHPNDEMVSFYSRSPSGFDVEFGCGGRLVDDDTWTVSEIGRPSLWGHRREA